MNQRSEKVSELVARQILEDIVDRGLPSGTMLPSESTMLEQFGVGRGSLREALRILEVYGIIQVKAGPRGGPTVARVTSRDFGRTATFYYHACGARLEHLMQARALLEPMMARVAAESADEQARKELAANLDTCRELIDAPSSSWAFHSGQFHGLVAGMSGNPILDLMCRSLNDIYVDRVRSIFPQEEREQVIAVHQRIADAIFAHDADEAERLSRRHIEEFVTRLRELGPGLFGEPLDWR